MLPVHTVITSSQVEHDPGDDEDGEDEKDAEEEGDGVLPAVAAVAAGDLGQDVALAAGSVRRGHYRGGVAPPRRGKRGKVQPGGQVLLQWVGGDVARQTVGVVAAAHHVVLSGGRAVLDAAVWPVAQVGVSCGATVARDAARDAPVAQGPASSSSS